MSLKRALLATVSLTFLFPFAAGAQTPAPGSAAAALATATAPAAVTAPVASAAAAAVTHAEFESLLRETLMNNPEIVMDAVKKLHDKHMEEANKQMQESLSKHKDELVNDTKSPSIGDPKKSDVTVIEFFDYHCGYCKHMLPAVAQLLKEDKKVHFIFREFPILAEDSALAARAAIAVYRIDKEKYLDFHTALMNSNGKFDDRSLAEVAKKVGVDPKKMKKEMADPEITAMLDNNRALAEDIGVRGTPALVINGDQLLPGAVPYEDLVKAIDNARKGIKPDIKSKPQASAEPVPAKPK